MFNNKYQNFFFVNYLRALMQCDFSCVMCYETSTVKRNATTKNRIKLKKKQTNKYSVMLNCPVMNWRFCLNYRRRDPNNNHWCLKKINKENTKQIIKREEEAATTKRAWRSTLINASPLWLCRKLKRTDTQQLNTRKYDHRWSTMKGICSNICMSLLRFMLSVCQFNLNHHFHFIDLSVTVAAAAAAATITTTTKISSQNVFTCLLKFSRNAMKCINTRLYAKWRPLVGGDTLETIIYWQLVSIFFYSLTLFLVPPSRSTLCS